jgi:hypothetical protein
MAAAALLPARFPPAALPPGTPDCPGCGPPAFGGVTPPDGLPGVPLPPAVGVLVAGLGVLVTVAVVVPVAVGVAEPLVVGVEVAVPVAVPVGVALGVPVGVAVVPPGVEVGVWVFGI